MNCIFVSNLKYQIKILVLIPFLFIFVLSGTVMNFYAMINNGGKMPVKYEYYFDTGRHFSYDEFNDVNLWYFTDIFNVRGFIFSVGDIIIIGGYILIVILVIILVVQDFKIKKIERRTKCKEKN